MLSKILCFLGFHNSDQFFILGRDSLFYPPWAWNLEEVICSKCGKKYPRTKWDA